MRRATSLLITAASAGVVWAPLPARATCRAPASPCGDAEPMWQSPAADRLSLVTDTSAPAGGALALSAGSTFRLRPAVLNVPAPSRDGRDVNVIRHATDVWLAVRVGIGERLEVTALLPAGLYQRGAGIKGVTDQAAPEISAQALHDPRIGFGYSFDTHSRDFGVKLRFEAKLPLGDRDSLAGESSFVASPSLAFSCEAAGFFCGAELGVRLRRPTEFFGARVGSQASIAAGFGYELPRPRLAISAELYALPPLVAGGGSSYFPGEWLAALRWLPNGSRWAFGLGGGSGLPFSAESTASFAFGVPSFRALAFVRFASSAR